MTRTYLINAISSHRLMWMTLTNRVNPYSRRAKIAKDVDLPIRNIVDQALRATKFSAPIPETTLQAVHRRREIQYAKLRSSSL